MNNKKIIRTILILNIILIILINFTGNKIKETKKVVDIETKDIKYQNIVFLGDSIIDWYPIEDMYDSEIPIINSGIAGYETTDILKRMDEMVYQYNPTKVFILIGTNDLKYSRDDEKKVADNIIEIINNIKKNRPQAKIYLQSIYPVSRVSKHHMAEERYNDEIIEVNEIIKKYCSNNDVVYIDMYKELSDKKGNFNKEYTNDGLHPNDVGYIKITSTLLKYIY